eukprot:m.33339 g.33339  ORF g.33339 m.33339 type:complete len:202 (+) comp31803_c0_seq5:219-824(+)
MIRQIRRLFAWIFVTKAAQYLVSEFVEYNIRNAKKKLSRNLVFLKRYLEAAFSVLGYVLSAILLITAISSGFGIASLLMMVLSGSFLFLASGACLLAAAIFLKEAGSKTWIIAAVAFVTNFFIGKTVVLDAYGEGRFKAVIWVLSVLVLLKAVLAGNKEVAGCAVIFFAMTSVLYFGFLMFFPLFVLLLFLSFFYSFWEDQ